MDKLDPAPLRDAINRTMACINAKKKHKDAINYDFVRHLAVQQFQEIRYSNPQATLLDAVTLVMKQYCPELFKASAPPPVPVPAPAPAPAKIDDENLLRRYYRMKLLIEKKEKLDGLDEYMENWNRHHKKTAKESALHREAYSQVLNEKITELLKEIESLGGMLKANEIEYVESLPELVMKIHKIKVRGLGKRRCPKCGLQKK